MKKQLLKYALAVGFVMLALSPVARGGGLMDGWDYYQGDLGGPWEALRTDKKTSRFPAWQASWERRSHRDVAQTYDAKR